MKYSLKFAVSAVFLLFLPLNLSATPSKTRGNSPPNFMSNTLLIECPPAPTPMHYMCEVSNLTKTAQKTNTENSYHKLEKYLSEIELSAHSYKDIFDAYHALLNHAVISKNDAKIIEYSNIVINDFIEKQDDYNTILYPFYRDRGIAIFRYGVDRPSPKINWKKPSSVKFWIESVNDLRKARVVYGKQKSATDIEYMQTVVWDLAIDGYFRSKSPQLLNDLEKLRLRPIIQPSKAVMDTYSDHSILCSPFGRISTSIDVPSEYAKDFTYGAAIGFYDLDENRKITNVRVPLIIPGNHLTESVKKFIEDIKYVPDSDNINSIPTACIKDRLALIRIIK